MRLLEVYAYGAAFAAVLWGWVGLTLIDEDGMPVSRAFIAWLINTAGWPITLVQAAVAVISSLRTGGES
jgi:hypothetical protein